MKWDYWNPDFPQGVREFIASEIERLRSTISKALKPLYDLNDMTETPPILAITLNVWTGIFGHRAPLDRFEIRLSSEGVIDEFHISVLHYPSGHLVDTDGRIRGSYNVVCYADQKFKDWEPKGAEP